MRKANRCHRQNQLSGHRWLLAHTLADTGYAGRPSDYFDSAERENHTREWGLPAGDLALYAREVRDKATTPNGVLGSKMMWNDSGHRPARPLVRTRAWSSCARRSRTLSSSGCGV